MTGAVPTSSPLWDDYGYHHDDLVESASIMPAPRGADPTRRGYKGCFHEEACASCGVMLRRCIPREECPDLSPT